MIRGCNKKKKFSIKTDVVGTEKNRLDEMALLSIKTYDYVKTESKENIYNFTFKLSFYLAHNHTVNQRPD